MELKSTGQTQIRHDKKKCQNVNEQLCQIELGRQINILFAKFKTNNICKARLK